MRSPGATDKRKLVDRPRAKPAPTFHHRGGSHGRPQFRCLGAQLFHRQRLHSPIEPCPFHRSSNRNQAFPSGHQVDLRRAQNVWQVKRRRHPDRKHLSFPGFYRRGRWALQPGVLHAAPPTPRNSSRKRPRSPFPSAFSPPRRRPGCVTASTCVSCCNSTPAAAAARGRAAHRSRGFRLASSIQQKDRPSVAKPGMRLSASCALKPGHTLVSLG